MPADQLITTTETAAIVPEHWSENFYDVHKVALVFADMIDNSWENEVTDLGDIVNISQIPEFSEANELPEGARGVAESITVSGQQLTMNKRFYKDFIITKKARLQSLRFMDQVRDMAIFSILKKLQSYLLTLSVPSASSPDHQIAFDSGTQLQLADITEAYELLLAQDVPIDDNWYMGLGSEQFVDLFSITGFTSRDFIDSGSPLTSGRFQTPILGFTPRFSTVFGDVSYFFHKSFMTYALQQGLNVEVHPLGADGTRGVRVNIDILGGGKQLDNKRVVEIS